MGISQVFTNGFKSYQGSMPELKVRRNRVSSFLGKPLATRGSLTIGQLISSMLPAPGHSVLLGRCADGLSFLLTLHDPALGAILVSADRGCGKTHQLQVITDSAVRINAPHEMQIAIISLHPDEWDLFQKDPLRKRYLQEVCAWYDDRSVHLIKELTELAEARREGSYNGPDVLLILDDLNFIENLSYEAQVNLYWLLAYGPQVGLWPVATLKACYAPDFRYWIEAFRTLVIGKIGSKVLSKSLTSQVSCQAHKLEPGLFQVWAGNQWLSYELPLLGD